MESTCRTLISQKLTSQGLKFPEFRILDQNNSVKTSKRAKREG